MLRHARVACRDFFFVLPLQKGLASSITCAIQLKFVSSRSRPNHVKWIRRSQEEMIENIFFLTNLNSLNSISVGDCQSVCWGDNSDIRVDSDAKDVRASLAAVTRLAFKGFLSAFSQLWPLRRGRARWKRQHHHQPLSRKT